MYSLVYLIPANKIETPQFVQSKEHGNGIYTSTVQSQACTTVMCNKIRMSPTCSTAKSCMQGITDHKPQSITLPALTLSEVLLPEVSFEKNLPDLLSCDQGNMGSYVTASARSVQRYLPQVVKNLEEQQISSIEVLGDNFDITISPNYMTEERQRKSLHWFLVLMKEVQVPGIGLPNDKPKALLENIPNHEFLPSHTDCISLQQNFKFHVVRCLVKYMPHLQDFADCVPAYIEHPHVQSTKQKTKFLNCFLIEESENSGEGMIRILQSIMDRFVPHTGSAHPVVRQQVNLEGDVLTCERGATAQEALRNHGTTDFERMDGFAHRPGGLHRLMNLYQVYYVTEVKYISYKG